MKKILIPISLFIISGMAFALPVGNPADPILLTNGIFWGDCYEDCYDPCDPCGFDWNFFSLRFGYYGDFVFNRDLVVKEGVFEEERVNHAEINTNAGLLVLNLWDRLDIFTTIGGTKICFESGVFSAPNIATFEVETDTQFSWSVGSRLVLWECGCTSIGIEGQYFRTNPDIRRITVNREVSLEATFNAFPDDLELRYHEWQVGLGIAHRINMFVPYFAIKWSNAKFSFNDETPVGLLGVTLPELEQRSQWGYAFGVSLVDCDIMSLNIEGRLRDEKAVAVNAQIRF